MFRIFKSGYGVDYVIPYHIGDSLLGLIFGFAALVLMVWLAAVSAPFMYLPVLAILAGLLVLLYLGGGEDDARGRAAFYTAYPFFVYGWTGMCWAVFAATVPAGNGLLGVLGWLILAAVGIFLLVIPSFGAADNNFGGLVLLPLTVLWVSAIIFDLSDTENNYYQTAASLVKYMFRIFGIVMLAALLIYLFFTVKEIIQTRDAKLNTIGGFVMFLLGCLPVAAVPLLSTMMRGEFLAGILLAVYFLLALLSYRSGKRGAAPGVQFVMLPMLLSWLAKAVMPFVSGGESPLVPLAGVTKVFGVLQQPLFEYLAERVGGPSLAAFGDLLDRAFFFIRDLALKIFDTSAHAFHMPDLLVMAGGFFLLVFVLWAGTFIRDKIAG